MVDEGENQVEGISKTPPLEGHAKCLAHIDTGPVHQFRIKIAPLFGLLLTLFGTLALIGCADPKFDLQPHELRD
jgi:hypothetical protein